MDEPQDRAEGTDPPETDITETASTGLHQLQATIALGLKGVGKSEARPGRVPGMLAMPTVSFYPLL